jgi:hypothetical protein
VIWATRVVDNDMLPLADVVRPEPQPFSGLDCLARLSALASAGVNGSVRADRSVFGSVSWT